MAGKEGAAAGRLETGLDLLTEVFTSQCEALDARRRAPDADPEKIARAAKALADCARSIAAAELAVDKARASAAAEEPDDDIEREVDVDDEDAPPRPRSDRSDLVRRLAALDGMGVAGGDDAGAGGVGCAGDPPPLAVPQRPGPAP